MMQRLGFTACALLVGALVLVPPTMAKDTHSPTAGPDQLIELSGKPAHAEQRVERLAQTRDHRKRSPGAAVVAPPAAVIVKPPAAIVVKPPATRSPITLRGNQLKAKPGYILEKGSNNQVSARRVGGSPGFSVTMDCSCADDKGKCHVNYCEGCPIAVCSAKASEPCSSTCDWTPVSAASGLKVQ